MIKDPVCKMEIKNIDKAIKCDYQDKTYYFCSNLCMVQFEHEPGKYLNENKDNTNEHNHN